MIDTENLWCNSTIHKSCFFIFPQILDLDYNAISRIDEDAFRNTTVLETLKVSHNLLVSLPPIQDLAGTLITLRVAHNQIQMIPELYFSLCSVLERFEVSGNNLTRINNLSFSGLSSIRHLHFSDNLIVDIDDQFVRNLRSLRGVYLDGNQITHLPSLVTDGNHLKNLNVANNKIKDISENQIRDVWRLYTLNISCTLITELDFISVVTATFFDKKTTLTSVVLSDIGIAAFPMFFKSSMKRIDLSQNEIRCVDVQHLANMTNLQLLDIKHNHIGGFPDMGCKNGNILSNPWDHLQFPKLVTLIVDENQLTNLKRDLMTNMPSLQELFASFNKIEYMPFLGDIGEPLRHVYLDHNNISHIEEQHISGLSGLQTLQLSNNAIAYLGLHMLGNLNNLQLLDLRYNKLMTPPILTDITLSPSMEIVLTNNSYVCDLRMCLLENETLLLDGLLCSVPLWFAGRSIQSVMESMCGGKYCSQPYWTRY